MMNEQPIRDFHGRIIGYIEEKSNGDKIVRDFYKRVLGKYDKSTNTTRDFYGRIIARGESTGLLLSLKKSR